MLYNSIFNLFSFDKGSFLYLLHFYSNFQLIPPSSLCDIGWNSWFWITQNRSHNFSKVGLSFISLLSLAWSISNHQKALLLCLNLATNELSAFSSKRFTLYAWQKFDFVLCVKSYLNLDCGLPFMEANSTVNLVLFWEDIMELRIRENRNFVVPVDILTLFAHAPFSILFYSIIALQWPALKFYSNMCCSLRIT